MFTILIVEDELIVARDIRKTLERNGYTVSGVCRSAEQALIQLQQEKSPFVLVDIFLKGKMTGIDLAVKLNEAGIPFIYVSANSNQPVLEAAKTTRPYGFIVKPFREKDLLVSIDIAIYRHENNQQMQSAIPGAKPLGIRQNNPDANGKQNSESTDPGMFQGRIIARSGAMLKVFNLVNQVAPFDTSVLVLGESGTGKEGIANCIVQQSNRKTKPYIKINCAAIPAALMESEFFGHEKGSFTGASEKRNGKFELAAGGTILLDEIGEISLEVQAKLLRVLQEKEIQRIGSNVTIKTDVRIIAATSKNLEKEVAEGRFRLDLYYRLLVFPINLPPLRERQEDIPLLTDYFIRHYAEKSGKQVWGADGKVLSSFLLYDWPGNVRELQHFIERAVLLTHDNQIHESISQNNTPAPAEMRVTHSLSESVEEMEKNYILTVLKKSHFRIGGKGGAAELLNMPPTTLHSKIKKFGIKREYE